MFLLQVLNVSMNKVFLFTFLALSNPLQANHLAGLIRKRNGKRDRNKETKNNYMTSVAIQIYIYISHSYVTIQNVIRIYFRKERLTRRSRLLGPYKIFRE